MKKWWNGLPTEFQFGLMMAFLGVVCWANCGWCDKLHSAIGSLLTFLGALAGTVLTHGVMARSKLCNPDAAKDLMGDS